jgi:Lar family restriction alleviation protein
MEHERDDLELKPCPFCGQSPEMRESAGSVFISCETVGCPACAIQNGDSGLDGLAALTAWNRRAHVNETPDPLT